MEEFLLKQIIEDTLNLENITDEKKRKVFIEKYMEPLMIVDDEGKTIGQAPRGFAHRVGLRHRTVFVLIIAPSNKLLLQKRGKGAYSSPFRLDISVGGHVMYGEDDLLKSAIREMYEELGIRPNKSQFRMIADYNRDSQISINKLFERNRERRTLYEYSLSDSEFSNLTRSFSERISREEVQGFDWFKINQVIEAINNNSVADGLISNFLYWLETKTV
jgi:isopentenyldiphosphate isomerase